MTREYFLEELKKCICGGRDLEYGTPEDNFGLIAKLWSVWLEKDIDAFDVAIMMSMFKQARIKSAPLKYDSYIDACGYIVCAGEIATKEKQEKFKPNCELY